jgi:energy-coupling factor transporter ATP-binding protein EcfA2
MVEHAAEQLAEMADRIIVMEGGRIVADGPPEDVYHLDEYFRDDAAERAPQVAELLSALERDRLIELGRFTPREDAGVEVLIDTLSRVRVEAVSGA